MVDRDRIGGRIFSEAYEHMMRRLAIPLAFAALALIGTACGGSPTASQDSASSSEPEQPEPTATPVPSPTPLPEPTATPIPTPTPRPEPTATPSPTPQSEPQEADPTATPTPEPSPPLDAQEADAIRTLATAYWEALNAYEADKVLGYLEENYRLEEGEALLENIDLMKTFAVKLTVSEESAPEAVDDETREMYWTVKSPLNVEHVRMVFRQIEGEWKIIAYERNLQ